MRISREEKVKKVLFGCVDQFIKTGKPVGSSTLKEAGFEELSSATIRNYYGELEDEGYLEQLHTSGGRVPTDKAYRWYVETLEGEPSYASAEMQKVLNRETVDLGAYLLEAASWLAAAVKAPVLLSSPRFDHDLVKAIKPVVLDSKRCLFVIVTQFGQVLTELFPLDEKLSKHAEMRMEHYFNWRLSGIVDEKPEPFDELDLAEHFYRELMLRYMVRSAHFAQDEIIRSGFSHLLYSEDIKDSGELAKLLALFESPKSLRQILREAVKRPQLSYWVGKELGIPGAALMALPYKIGPRFVGAVAILGQARSPYQQWMETLYPFRDLLTKNLTFNIYQHGITFREPVNEMLPILIENKGLS